jgi:DNA-binding XRE family transcriptional regulator
MATNHPLRVERDKAGLSQAAVGTRVGVTRLAIVAYENGRRIPKPSVMVKLRELFPKLTADDFLPPRESTPVDGAVEKTGAGE